MLLSSIWHPLPTPPLPAMFQAIHVVLATKQLCCQNNITELWPQCSIEPCWEAPTRPHPPPPMAIPKSVVASGSSVALQDGLWQSCGHFDYCSDTGSHPRPPLLPIIVQIGCSLTVLQTCTMIKLWPFVASIILRRQPPTFCQKVSCHQWGSRDGSDRKWPTCKNPSGRCNFDLAAACALQGDTFPFATGMLIVS